MHTFAYLEAKNLAKIYSFLKSPTGQNASDWCRSAE